MPHYHYRLSDGDDAVFESEHPPHLDGDYIKHGDDAWFLRGEVAGFWVVADEDVEYMRSVRAAMIYDANNPPEGADL